MARYASGKQAWGFSDRSGFRYRLKDMVTEWNGSKVGVDEYEAKHPQLDPIKTGSDPQALYDPRPDQRTEATIAVLLNNNPFQSASSGSAVITVTERNHGRTSGDVVRFRKTNGFDGFTKAVLENASGYTITVVTADTYTFTASSGTATVGSTRGGGQNATAGPVTLSP